jgi:predicted ribosomally synthesized peptide with nif11-like leader
MSELIPSQFIEDAKHDETLKQKLSDAQSIDECVEIAHEYGYTFSADQLQTELDKLPEEIYAKAVDPGVGPRRHLPADNY